MTKEQLIQKELNKGRKIYKAIGPKRQVKDIFDNNKRYFNKIGAQIVSIEEKDFNGLNDLMNTDNCELVPFKS